MLIISALFLTLIAHIQYICLRGTTTVIISAAGIVGLAALVFDIVISVSTKARMTALGGTASLAVAIRISVAAVVRSLPLL